MWNGGRTDRQGTVNNILITCKEGHCTSVHNVCQTCYTKRGNLCTTYHDPRLLFCPGDLEWRCVHSLLHAVKHIFRALVRKPDAMVCAHDCPGLCKQMNTSDQRPTHTQRRSPECICQKRDEDGLTDKLIYACKEREEMWQHGGKEDKIARGGVGRLCSRKPSCTCALVGIIAHEGLSRGHRGARVTAAAKAGGLCGDGSRRWTLVRSEQHKRRKIVRGERLRDKKQQGSEGMRSNLEKCEQ